LTWGSKQNKASLSRILSAKYRGMQVGYSADVSRKRKTTKAERGERQREGGEKERVREQ